MPSPRALVGMRVAAEARLNRDVRALAETIDMPEDEIPTLLQPRVPNNDPGLKHVRWLEGVSQVMEKFLQHSGVDVEALHARPEEEPVPDHQRIEINPVPSLDAGPSDPRLVGVGQGLVDPSTVPHAGVVPGMLEGDEGQVKEAVDETTMADVGLLRDMERSRIGGARANILKILDDREARLRKDTPDPTAVPPEHQKVIDERAKQAEEAVAAAKAAEEATKPAPSTAAEKKVAGSNPTVQPTVPERPASAVRARRGGSGTF